MQTDTWLPLTEYALRSGTSISTLRRKIKSNSIAYKMEEGRYLIRGDEMMSEPQSNAGYASSDAPIASTNLQSQKPEQIIRVVQPATVAAMPVLNSEKEENIEVLELKATIAEQALRARAMEARVNGLAKKLDLYTEQMAELKMLVKIFEERLDGRI